MTPIRAINPQKPRFQKPENEPILFESKLHPILVPETIIYAHVYLLAYTLTVGDSYAILHRLIISNSIYFITTNER